jgi:hypothetical protein
MYTHPLLPGPPKNTLSAPVLPNTASSAWDSLLTPLNTLLDSPQPLQGLLYKSTPQAVLTWLDLVAFSTFFPLFHTFTGDLRGNQGRREHGSYAQKASIGKGYQVHHSARIELSLRMIMRILLMPLCTMTDFFSLFHAICAGSRGTSTMVVMLKRLLLAGATKCTTRLESSWGHG